jgi:molybdenum cofactor cytidylyltransferase
LRKGIVLGSTELENLKASGITSVTVARLDVNDIDEDLAAQTLAEAILPDPDKAHLRRSNAFTGRVNLIATGPGVLVVDVDAINALNAVHPMITCATVLPFARMAENSLAATIKIISYAVPKDALDQACNAARKALRLAPAVLKTAELIVTDTGSGPDDSKGIIAISDRLTRLGMSLERVTQVGHDEDAIAAALAVSNADLVLILTASATSDPHDTAPSALVNAGGILTRFGMPVDPGNLLFTGNIAGKPVIGLPGCARSPALNGADWVLERIACGLEISSEDIAGMGVGGLLKEIPQRPQPRRG